MSHPDREIFIHETKILGVKRTEICMSTHPGEVEGYDTPEF